MSDHYLFPICSDCAAIFWCITGKMTGRLVHRREDGSATMFLDAFGEDRTTDFPGECPRIGPNQGYSGRRFR
jgi:hypothetical protein